MPKNSTIEELIEITGFSNFKILTDNDAVKILTLIGQQRLKEAHIKALVQLAPGFIKLATESLRAITTVAKAAGDVQVETLKILQRSVDGVADALQTLAKSAKTDKTREKIAECILEAGRLYIELAKISREMNSQNNDFWLKMAGMAVSTLLAVLSIYAVSKRNGSNNDA